MSHIRKTELLLCDITYRAQRDSTLIISLKIAKGNFAGYYAIILADDGCNTATESSQTNRLLRVFHSCYFHYSDYAIITETTENMQTITKQDEVEVNYLKKSFGSGL